MSKIKKVIAQRNCIGCRKIQNKYEMFRIVKTPSNEIKTDLTGKAPGHGAYLCKNIECLKKALKRRQLDRAFKMKISSDIYDKIKMELENIIPN